MNTTFFSLQFFASCCWAPKDALNYFAKYMRCVQAMTCRSLGTRWHFEPLKYATVEEWHKSCEIFCLFKISSWHTPLPLLNESNANPPIPHTRYLTKWHLGAGNKPQRGFRTVQKVSVLWLFSHRPLQGSLCFLLAIWMGTAKSPAQGHSHHNSNPGLLKTHSPAPFALGYSRFLILHCRETSSWLQYTLCISA